MKTLLNKTCENGICLITESPILRFSLKNLKSYKFEDVLYRRQWDPKFQARSDRFKTIQIRLI